MPKLDKPVFLIRVDVQLPVGLESTFRKCWEGWHSVSLSDVRGNGNRVNACEWQLVANAKPLLKGGVGSTPQEATACALTLALRQVRKSFNAARVEYLQVHQYPWFYLSTVAVYPHTIKEDSSAVAGRGHAAVASTSNGHAPSNIDGVFSPLRTNWVEQKGQISPQPVTFLNRRSEGDKVRDEHDHHRRKRSQSQAGATLVCHSDPLSDSRVGLRRRGQSKEPTG